jgi:hypothetical protein
MQSNTALGLVVGAAVSLGATPAPASPEIVPAQSPAGALAGDVEGWNPNLGISTTLNLTSNSSVVGQVDGLSTQFGLELVSGADYVRGRQLWRNSISVTEAFARTPAVDRFLKTNDVVALESIYHYFLTGRFGAFARLKLTTALFAAEDVRSEPTTWLRKPDSAGAAATVVQTGGTRQRLADPFTPVSVSEAVGAFAEPVRRPGFSLSVRLGLGGRHTFADSVLLIDDDKATPEVELLGLSDVHQLGAEAFVGAEGRLEEGRLTYRAGTTVLVPFVNNDDHDRGVGPLTRVGLDASVRFTVLSWMALVYSAQITRDPQLFPEGSEQVQVQNNLLLSLQYTLVERRRRAAEPSTEDKLRAAEERARAAEAARQAAEERLKALEQNRATPEPPAPPPAPRPPN